MDFVPKSERAHWKSLESLAGVGVPLLVATFQIGGTKYSHFSLLLRFNLLEHSWILACCPWFLERSRILPLQAHQRPPRAQTKKVQIGSLGFDSPQDEIALRWEE